MRKWRIPGIGVQAKLLRIALVSLPVILILSLLATVAQASQQESVSVTVRYRGQTTKTTASGETVGELLFRLGLEVSGEDVVSHAMEDRVAENMVVVIDCVVKTQEVYTAIIPHTVSYCWDPSTPKGVETVLVRGVDGEMKCTANVTYINGKEISREIIGQDVTVNPIEEVIAQGSGEGEAAPEEGIQIRDGYIILPTGEVLTYGEVRTVAASAYSHMDKGCNSITATGKQVHWGTVAVNPKYIPYGTRMFITSSDGSFVYGIATAEDNGGAISEESLLLYMPTYYECMQFGKQTCTVYFLG